MLQESSARLGDLSSPALPTSRPTDLARQAFLILRFGFTVAPIVAGLDKFTRLLVNWDQYLSPLFARLSPLDVHPTMLVVGVIEIAAGLGVALKPRIFSYVVAAWLVGIMLNLLLTGSYYDVALRDLGLFLGALALGRLSEAFEAFH
jgi:uncharacterized membrane protein YphA (DoxX/SURF4 family)